MDAISSYRSELARYFEADSTSVSLFWKGRVGLLAILEALEIGPGDEVLLPAFTCVVVPNVILYRGATPVYADIDEETYNLDISKLPSKITPKTRVILAQNTFGLSSDIDAIQGLARPRHIRVVEDACHGFGSRYKGCPSGSCADAAFFSSQWNKPFSTGVGGFTFAKDPHLARRIQAIEQAYLMPRLKETVMIRGLLIARDALLTPATYWALMRMYRELSRRNIVVGSSSPGEMDGPVMPEGFEKRLSATQASRGLKELGRIEASLSQRRKVAAAYRQMLVELGIKPAVEPQYAQHGFLKYPLRVKNRSAFVEHAKRAKIELGDWFISPLHPIERKFEKWNYSWGSNPVAEKISAEVVNLPTHLDVDVKYLDRIRGFLVKWRHDLI